MSFLRRLAKSLQNTDSYVHAVTNTIRDGNIDPNELAELRRISLQLKLSPEQIHKAHIAGVDAFVQQAMADGYFDPAEMAALHTAMTHFSLTTADLPPATVQKLTWALQLQQLATGALPALGQLPIQVNLKQGEVVHLCTPSSTIEEKVVARRTSGAHSGVSFRVARGVRFHVGGSRGLSVPVYEPVVTSRGFLVLTSSTARYVANAKSFNKPWGKVSAVEPYCDGIAFFLADRQNAIILTYQDRSIAPVVEIICGRLLT